MLLSRSDPQWLPLAIKQFDRVLIDHAHCEKKAAAHALSMLQAYPEIPGLPGQMARLAREESSHLSRVLSIIESRGLKLTRDLGDPYVQGLHLQIRKTQTERCLDRLLISAIVESRSCERLSLLASGLEEVSLRNFYTRLAQSEAGHQTLFLRLAEQTFPAPVVAERLDWLLRYEAELIGSLEVRPSIH